MIHTPKPQLSGEQLLKDSERQGFKVRREPKSGDLYSVSKFRVMSAEEEAKNKLLSPHVYRAVGGDYDPYK